jgi:predicted DNA-binding protein
MTAPILVHMKRSSKTPRTLEAKVAYVARRLGKPRRLVLKEAIDEYIARHEPEAITEAMNRVAQAVDTHPEPALAAAARSILERTEW